MRLTLDGQPAAVLKSAGIAHPPVKIEPGVPGKDRFLGSSTESRFGMPNPPSRTHCGNCVSAGTRRRAAARDAWHRDAAGELICARPAAGNAAGGYGATRGTGGSGLLLGAPVPKDGELGVQFGDEARHLLIMPPHGSTASGYSGMPTRSMCSRKGRSLMLSKGLTSYR